MGASTKSETGGFPSLGPSTLTKVASDEWISSSLARLEIYEEFRDELKVRLETAPEGDAQTTLLELIVSLERKVAKLYRQLEVIAEAREGADKAAKGDAPGVAKQPAKPLIEGELPPPPIKPLIDPKDIPPPPIGVPAFSSAGVSPREPTRPNPIPANLLKQAAVVGKRHEPSGPHLSPPPDWGTASSTEPPQRPDTASWNISKLTRDKVSETPSGSHSIAGSQPDTGSDPGPDLLAGPGKKGRGERYRTMREVPKFKTSEHTKTSDELVTASGTWKRPDTAQPPASGEVVSPASPGAPKPTPDAWQQPTPAPVKPTQPQAKPTQPQASDWQQPQAAPAPAHAPSSIASPLNRTQAGHAKGTDVAPQPRSNHPFAGAYTPNPLNRPNARPIANPLNQARLDPHPAAFPVTQQNPHNPLNQSPSRQPRAMTPVGGAPRLGQPFPFRAVSSDYDDRGSTWTQTQTYDDDDITYPGSSRGLWFFVLLLLAGAAAGGYYWYTHGGRAMLQPATAEPKPASQPPRVIRSNPVLPDTQGPAVETGGAVEQSRGTVFKKRRNRPRSGGRSVSTSVRPGTDAIDADTIKKPNADTKVVKTDDPFEGADK